ncbi:MAG: BamA/TamA family outer membrane protein [Bacteroidales bacterium]|nr:BamA/TamA family outer membrane protein [Bacteroidales bacterium]
MRSRSFIHACTTLASVLLLSACGAGTKLAADQYALVKNRIEIVGQTRDLKKSDISPYIRQQPPPFLSYGEKTVFEERLVHLSEDKIRDHLRYMGYYDAVVESRVDRKGRKASVLYHIVPGERIRIRQLRFDVPQGGTFAEDFYADTLNVSVGPGDWLSEQSLEAESERSASVMRNRGYYGFTKNYYYFEADTLSGRDSVTLLMQVREYTRNETAESARPLHKSWIGDVTVERPSRLPFRDKVLADINTIRPGELYNEKAVNNTYDRFRSLQLFSGVGVELNPASEDTVDCTITLTPSRLQGFKVNFETSTNSSGLIGISPQLNYYHKNIFHGGELLNLGFLGNFQFKLRDQVRSDEFGVSVGVTFPQFLGLPNRIMEGSSLPRTEIKTSFNYQDRPEYTRNIVSASFGYSGRFFNQFYYQLYPLQFNMVRLYNLDPDFYKTLESNPFMRYTYQDHFDAGLSGMLYYTSGTGLTDLEPAWYARAAGDLSGNVISLFHPLLPKSDAGQGKIFGAPYTQYVKAEFTLGRTWRFGLEDGQAVATRLTGGLGYAYGNSTALPFEKQFYCGGANSMRGWQTRTLGPGRSGINTAFSIPSQTGDVKLEANVEYRFTLAGKLEGALFYDLGNVWTIDNTAAPEGNFDKDFYKSLAMDWGLGLRFKLSFLVARLDLGLKLYEPSAALWRGPGLWFRNDGFAVHFGVGYPF